MLADRIPADPIEVIRASALRLDKRGVLLAALAGGVALAGCVTLTGCVTPPPRMAAAPLPGVVPLGGWPPGAGAPDARWPDAAWWRGFNDPTLDALVERTLAEAPDLAAATARFDAARAAVAAARAEAGVQVGAGADASRQRLSDSGLFPPQLLGFHWYGQYDLGLQASYSFDWWGRKRAAIAAAVGGARAAQAERAAAALALACSTVELYYGWQSDMAARDLALQRTALAEQQARIATARSDAQVDRDDSRQRAELLVLEARDRLGELTASAQLRRVALAALQGAAPGDLPALISRPLPGARAGLPPDATLDLIARRPDIAAARARVEAASQSLEAARDDFLPNLNLSALLQLSSQKLGRLLEAGSFAPTFAAAVHVPLFSAGTLKAEYERSHAGLAAAVADYRAALLAAAREVNTQLVNRQHWLEQAQLRAAQRDAASALQAAAALRTLQGIADERAQLEALDTLLASQQAQLRTQAAALQSDLELIRALGGGYRTEPLHE